MSKLTLAIDKEERIKPSLLPSGSAGFQQRLYWEERPNKSKKYAIFQNVTRSIKVTDHDGKVDTDEASFVEVFYEFSTSKNVDSFVIPKVWREGNGELIFRSTTWIDPNYTKGQQLTAEGFKKGKLGVDPWGATYGRQGHMNVPKGILLTNRNVRLSWNNRKGQKLPRDGSDISFKDNNQQLRKTQPRKKARSKGDGMDMMAKKRKPKK